MRDQGRQRLSSGCLPRGEQRVDRRALGSLVEMALPVRRAPRRRARGQAGRADDFRAGPARVLRRTRQSDSHRTTPHPARSSESPDVRLPRDGRSRVGRVSCRSTRHVRTPRSGEGAATSPVARRPGTPRTRSRSEGQRGRYRSCCLTRIELRSSAIRVHFRRPCRWAFPPRRRAEIAYGWRMAGSPRAPW